MADVVPSGTSVISRAHDPVTDAASRRMESEMRLAPLLQFSRIVRTAIAVLLLAASVVSAQDVTEPVLKGAFLYHFAIYTEWPPEALAAGAPLVICVVGDTAVA